MNRQSKCRCQDAGGCCQNLVGVCPLYEKFSSQSECDDKAENFYIERQISSYIQFVPMLTYNMNETENIFRSGEPDIYCNCFTNYRMQDRKYINTVFICNDKLHDHSESWYFFL